MKKYLHIMRTSSIFSGMTDEEILSILHCMDAKVLKRPRGSFILHGGQTTQSMGLLLQGSGLIMQEDIWGRRNIIDIITPADTFLEAFACTGNPLSISVAAETDCEILMLNTERILHTCPTACAHHTRVIGNLVETIARKTLRMNDKITHMSRRSTREKLLSYLSSESIRQGSLCFTIPFDRQQLADFLCVERSAMSAELSRLRKEGVLSCTRNRFQLFTSVSL